MEIREATETDAEDIREVAHASLHESYEGAIGEQALHEALDTWYEVPSLRNDIVSDDLRFNVAEDAESIVGFSQSHLRDAEGRIQWVHVHPDHRQQGIGSMLLDRTCGDLTDEGVERITGVVLAANEAGIEFYRDRGFALAETRTVTVGGRFHDEHVFEAVGVTTTDLTAISTPDGEMYVDKADRYRGQTAPFYPVYRTENGTHRYGWYCDGCGSVDSAMDTMERIVCNGCGNARKPARWDAAYL